jgi:hypothetical protein
MICLPASGNSIPFSRPVAVHVMKTYKGRRGTAPLIHLGTGWRKVVSLTLRPALLRGNPVPIEQEGGRFGEEANFYFRIVQPVTYSLYRVPHPDAYVYLGYPESVHTGVPEYDSVARRASRFM